MFPRDHNKRAMDSQKPTMLFCFSLPHLLNLSVRRSGSARQKGLPSQKLMVSIKEESGKTSTEMSSCPYIISGNPRDLYGSYNIKDIREADILKTLQNCASQCGANYVSKLKSVWKKIYIVGQRKRVVQTDLSHLVENPRSEIVTERSLNEQNITEEEFELFCQAMSEYGHYLPSEKEKIYNRKKYCVQIHFNTTDTIASNRGYLFYNLDMGLLSFLFPTAEDIGKRRKIYCKKNKTV